MTEKKKKLLVFSREEVERFFKEVETVRLRLDSMLDFHFREQFKLSETSLKCTYEMILDSIAFKENLEEFFPPEEKRTFFRIKEEDVLFLSKLTLMMGHSKSMLLASGVSLEAQ